MCQITYTYTIFDNTNNEIIEAIIYSRGPRQLLNSVHHLCPSRVITVIRVQLGINCPVPSGRKSQTERRRDHCRGGGGGRKKKQCVDVYVWMRVACVRACIRRRCQCVSTWHARARVRKLLRPFLFPYLSYSLLFYCLPTCSTFVRYSENILAFSSCLFFFL